MPDLQLTRQRVIVITCQYLPVFADIIDNKIKIRGNNASKEKHSLTRKLVGYRNWSQRLCKKEGNKVEK